MTLLCFLAITRITAFFSNMCMISKHILLYLYSCISFFFYSILGPCIDDDDIDEDHHHHRHHRHHHHLNTDKEGKGKECHLSVYYVPNTVMKARYRIFNLQHLMIVGIIIPKL